MSFVHQYFSVDSAARKVFDINNKELYLTGNTYRVLVFLCEKKNATLTEIGAVLDWAKDYDENNIRQYRYKINTMIGRPIIEYKNGIYSIIGEVKNVEKIEQNHRNTDLLHPSHINWESMKNKSQFSKWPAVIATVVLLLSFLHMPYSFYNFLRFVVTVTAVYYAYYLYDVVKHQDGLFWALVVIGIAFNPFFPVYLGKKSSWQIIDIIVMAFFVFLIIKLGKLNKLKATN